ncbi:MAG: hypothetical protein ACOCX4_04425, partial [Planctomycetota bacterium]
MARRPRTPPWQTAAGAVEQTGTTADRTAVVRRCPPSPGETAMPASPPPAVVLLSGGLDSATAAAVARA